MPWRASETADVATSGHGAVGDEARYRARDVRTLSLARRFAAARFSPRGSVTAWVRLALVVPKTNHASPAPKLRNSGRCTAAPRRKHANDPLGPPCVRPEVIDRTEKMGVIKVTPDTASLISVCDMLDDMKVSWCLVSCDGRVWRPSNAVSCCRWKIHALFSARRCTGRHEIARIPRYALLRGVAVRASGYSELQMHRSALEASVQISFGAIAVGNRRQFLKTPVALSSLAPFHRQLIQLEIESGRSL